jgi:DNA-binding CsgD family transcriptional regulator
MTAPATTLHKKCCGTGGNCFRRHVSRRNELCRERRSEMVTDGGSEYGGPGGRGSRVRRYPARLRPVELLTLQLAAYGYSFAQIALVRQLPESAIAGTVRGAFRALAVTTLDGAIAGARQSGLIS